jgi:type I restriction-modification system DNA methylase subunit
MTLVNPEGPFLSIPVLNQVFPNGVDRPEQRSVEIANLMGEHKLWRKKKVEHHEAWIRTVLTVGAKWPADQVLFKDEIPSKFEVVFPEHGANLKPWAVLFDSDNKADRNPVMLVTTVPIGQDLRAVPVDGWAASPIDRLARLLRRSKVQVGLVTDGCWWALVWADSSTSTASAIFDSRVWNEELLVRDAFFSLVGIKRQIGVDEDDRLPQLFQKSLIQQEEITETLGRQVRRAVELLVQSFSESRISALENSRPDPMPTSENEPYEAAVTMMMRIIFILFAEERGLLPINQVLYGRTYGLSGLLDELESENRRDATILDRSSSVWYRLLAASNSLFFGASFEDMRMPAYGGSLFDPNRFSWVYKTSDGTGLDLVVNDRVMLNVLKSIQVVNQNSQARRISFREVDVEQIGYVYEGLLGYASKWVSSDTVLGLMGSEGNEPEISLSKVVSLRAKHKSDEKFIEELLQLIAEEQPAAKPPSQSRLLSNLKTAIDEPIARQKLGAVTGHNQKLIDEILPFTNLLREDLRGLPYVVPRNGIAVTETTSRKNAGAHYTPNSLAEEVVLHALEPIVYSPGPLQEQDQSKWVLKSSVEILNLKIADIAVGSGAFLVAAARYLAMRLVEAWKIEGVNLGAQKEYDPDRPFDPMMTRALREVVARCLYGADINEMAVEMCKLSLWLISLDPARPFSFLDDKVMHGNSLLGLTSIEQLRALHIDPLAKHGNFIGELFNEIDAPIETATRLRNEIASTPVDDADVHRSASHKANLLRQANEATAHLRELADAVIAAGLPLGGKPGKKLNDAYSALNHAVSQAFPNSGVGNRTTFDRIVDVGLTPTVKTDYYRWKPLHWILEAPQVMERGGFDAIIGNPPFLVSKKVSGAVGSNLREWLVNTVAKKSGNGDLIAYFFRRAFELLAANGTLGLIGAKAISEGDSLQVGIEPLYASGVRFFRVDRNRKWPSRNVGTNIAIVWAVNGEVKCPAVLDGKLVSGISQLLLSEDGGLIRPAALTRPKLVFKGDVFLGDGFLINGEKAAELLSKNSLERAVIHPFLNAMDLNSRVDRIGPNWIIDFGSLSKIEAKRHTGSWGLVEHLVKPEREKLDPKKYKWRRENWWRFASSSEELKQKLTLVKFAVAIPVTSKLMIPASVSSRQVFSSALAICPIESPSFFALISSWMHRSWAQWWGSKMRDDFRYSISDCFDTFPFCISNKTLDKLGKELDEMQRALAIQRDIGLTKLYNLVNSDVCDDRDVKELRAVHEKIDREVIKAFGFSLTLGKYEVAEFKGLSQWGPPEGQRIEILQLLLAENQRQHSEGVIEWPTK